MGFDVNFNKPIIKEAQSMQDGGAGNLGYFEQEKKKKEDKDKSIFSEAKEKEKDSFEKHDGSEDSSFDFSISKIIAQIILAVKDWFRKTFGG